MVARPLKDHLEVKGYGDAARWVYARASGTGAREHDIRPFVGGMVAVPRPPISAELTTWVDNVRRGRHQRG